MRIVSIVGARPQFVKLAPVSRAMANAAPDSGDSLEDIIVHTGQHYDAALSRVFFDELQIPTPTVNLEIGSGQHGEQTARMITAIEQTLVDKKPDMVVIYGDTNSTLAGALAAAKLNIPVAHIEAGLRSFNRAMPEEVNRVVADHVSDLLLAPTQTAMKNLAAENLGSRAVETGDVMLDAVRFNVSLAQQESKILDRLELESGRFGVVTMHRAGNTDTENLGVMLDTLNKISSRLPLVFPVHPRTKARIANKCPDWRASAGLKMVEPVSYLDMIRLLDSARLVLTDSGGLQKEAFFLSVPCITMRSETEWPETVEGGNVLVGTDAACTIAAVDKAIDAPKREDIATRYFGDGHAAELIVSQILQFLSNEHVETKK